METRAYFFTNMYISDIQKGIQTAHCVSDMHRKYDNSDYIKKYSEILNRWSDYHKTMIVLNGGYSSNLKSIIDVFETSSLPWCQFYESMEALDGALTCVGIIVPESIYENAKSYHNLSEDDANELWYDTHNDLTFEANTTNMWLVQNLSKYRLA